MMAANDDDANNKQDQEKTATAPSFFQRLLGLGAGGPSIEISISPFIDAAGQNHAKSIAQAFHGLKDVRAKVLRGDAPIDPEGDRQLQLPAACGEAFKLLGENKSDLVIWGDIPDPGTTLYLHFVSAPAADEDPVGTFSPFQALMLPVGFDPEVLGGLLQAAALAAIHPTDINKLIIRRDLAPDLLERAINTIAALPDDFTTRETAAAHAALANALSAFAYLFPGTEHQQRASLSYTKALKGTSRTEAPVNWAYLKKNLGMVLQAIGEKNKRDMVSLELAKTAYEEALEVFSFQKTPFPWATIQTHLGEVLYRMDAISGTTDMLKPALNAYQSALKVFTKKQMPKLWATTKNNLAQAAQVMGRELGNQEVVERAVSACRAALEVRTRDKMPLQWAQTQNILGSALFQLARMTSEADTFEQALDAFTNARDAYADLKLSKMVSITEKNISRTEDRLPNRAKRAPGEKDPALWWMDDDDGGVTNRDDTPLAEDLGGLESEE